MMKFAIFLIGLLHLCYSTKKTELNKEMIGRLENLDKLYNKQKLNITSLEDLRVPNRTMHKHPHRCAGIVFRHLEDLLNNVTVDEDSNYILEELKANLQAREPEEMKNNPVCQMTMPNRAQKGHRKHFHPFQMYAQFLRKLNSSVRR